MCKTDPSVALKILAFAFGLIIPALAVGQTLELNRIHVIGNAVIPQDTTWYGYIKYASWLDDETIVYLWSSGVVTAWSLKTNTAVWSVKDVHNVTSWSVSRNKRRLAILYNKKGEDRFSGSSVRVIDCVDGHPLLDVDSKALAKMLDIDFAIPTQIALTPTEARLVVCNLCLHYNESCFVFDKSYEKPELAINVDAAPLEPSVSPDGSRITTIAESNVICIYDIENDEQIYFQGDRIHEGTDSIGRSTDSPFFSHALHDGADMLIYTMDHGWGNGKVFVHDIKTGQNNSFDARNGHIEVDVDFDRKRIALTGTSTDLSLLGFDGKVLAHLPKATLKRNSSVSFSPSGKMLLVGSWDNTVSVFEIGK